MNNTGIARSSPVAPTPGDVAAGQLRPVRISMWINLLTLIPVLTVAVLSGSILLLTDIIDYAKSIGADLLTLNILRKIRRGDIHEYDYGHGKLEVVGGLASSLLFVLGLMALAGFAFYRLLHPVELSSGFTFIGILFMLGGVVVNAWLWRRFRAEARQTSAPLMEMQWRAKRADAFSALAVFVALTATLVFRSWRWALYIDPVCALLFIFYATGSFVPTIQSCINDLLDKTLAEDLQLKIVRRLAENYDGYEEFHGVRSRRAGHRIFVEIGLSFNPAKTVGEALDTMTSLREGVESDIPNSEVSIIVKPPERMNLAREERTSIQILPLSPATLGPALEMIRSTFELMPDEMPQAELEESVTPGKHTAALAEKGISDPAYWVAFYHNKVAGVSGIFYRPHDRHEAVWGGWTAYDAKFRTGLSRARYLMLKKTAIEAKATGRKYFRLYTSTDPQEQQANHFYDRIGLNVYKTEPLDDGGLILYRQAEIEHLFSRIRLKGAGSRRS